MIALLIAAALSGPAADRQLLLETPPLIANPYYCREVAEKVREGQREAFSKLGKLPPAHGEYAVMRKVEGCMAPAPLGHHPRPQDAPNP
jgi:hypothetical protein